MTPGTAAWLRAMADEHEDLAEGLIRAAHRIERLQNELGKQKTGVDPSYQPLPMPHGLFPQALNSPTRNFPVYRIRLPEGELASEREAHDSFFDWINASENLGMGLLNPCMIHVLDNPDVKGGTWDLDVLIGCTSLIENEEQPKGFVRICGISRTGPLNILEKHLGCIDLKECFVIDVETGDETIIELVAKEAVDVGQDTDDSVSS